jgi:thiamine biosynthesis lipoprotein
VAGRDPASARSAQGRRGRGGKRARGRDSGPYARGAHIVDPYSCRTPEGVLSVTVTGPELATADAYATAAYAMGPDFGPPWTARLRGYEAMTILANGTVLSTGGFPAV